MNPSHFRQQSLGRRGLLVVVLNEIQAFRSNLGLLVSMTMQPLLYFAFLVMGISATTGSVRYAGQRLPYASYAVIGVIGLIMMTQMSQAIYRSTVDKQFGLLAVKFMSGVQPGDYIMGMSVFPLLGYFYQCLILTALAYGTGLRLNLVGWGITIGAGSVFLLFWSSLGIICSAWFKNYQQRDVVMQLLFSPIAFTAPSFYVDGQGPTYLRWLANLNPLTYQLRALRALAYGNFTGSVLLVGFIPTVVMITIAILILRRLPLTLQEH
ncbi:ABC transporter permease [Fructilactobacillus hinvesii]|uniref:Transport permease protein n=1 Tax=Fructilactobacillus hinvesii TaxID=2940300 RepID=A0ABY5BV55_9LACO|nr:ABC transporter permease [Fructilactobacillus hinvesii]USS88550.1 ABC transporter permease [Fructilactobacillus hinvesii]